MATVDRSAHRSSCCSASPGRPPEARDRARRLVVGAPRAAPDRSHDARAARSTSSASRSLVVPRTGDEVAHLATSLNAMLDRIEHGVEEQRGLRPTRPTSCAERCRRALGDRRQPARRRPAALQRARFLERREELGRMPRTVDDLLVLARSTTSGRRCCRAAGPARRRRARVAALASARAHAPWTSGLSGPRRCVGARLERAVEQALGDAEDDRELREVLVRGYLHPGASHDRAAADLRLSLAA